MLQADKVEDRMSDEEVNTEDVDMDVYSTITSERCVVKDMNVLSRKLVIKTTTSSFGRSLGCGTTVMKQSRTPEWNFYRAKSKTCPVLPEGTGVHT